MDINQVWPEWHEDCVLGEGSFGKVYRAKRVEYGRTFYSAIKVISVPKTQQEVKNARSQGMNDSEIYNYFQSLVDNLLNEITLMDNLKGAKNIVGIDDYKIIEHEGEIGWDIFIRMELLTAFDSFVSNPEFSQKDVIRLGVDICSALEVCEQNYIIHRDIKPDNIFVSRFGEYKLGDFGIARKLEATQANLSRKGTLNYMAPEVYKSEEYGASVDIYSLGLVLYTLLNNNRIAFLPPYPQPITYRDNEEALSRRLSGAPLDPPCNASASLGATILRACAYRPEDRYATATEFKNALINEWNVLVQSGDNRGISSDAMRFGSDGDERLKNTTNDMTANGRLVVDEYAQGTTVLEGDNQYASGYNYSQSSSSQDRVVVPDVGGKKSSGYSSSKSNKFCKIASYPLSIAVAVLAVISLINSDAMVSKTVALSMLGFAIITVIAGHNKLSVGVCMAAGSIGYIFQGLSGLIGGGIQESLPVFSIFILVAGVLTLFGGISVSAQKEARLGGSMFLYALILEWLFYVYQLINGSFHVETWHIYYGVTEIAAFIWAYGYNSSEEVTGIKKILQITTYVAAGAIGILAIVSTVAAIKSFV